VQWLACADASLNPVSSDSRRPLAKAPRDPACHQARGGQQIIYLRQNYHFGAHKIAMYLKRCHDVEASPSGVWRFLMRLT
jgi:hypothetical protein